MITPRNMRQHISIQHGRPCGSTVQVRSIGTIAILMALASCTRAEPPADATAPAASATTVSLSAGQLKNAGIVTGKAERRSLGVLMPVQGVVDVPPQNLVSISAPLGGYLRSTDLLPGMEVQKGQTLAIMEDPRFIQLQQDYLVAEGVYSSPGLRAPESVERHQDRQRQGVPRGPHRTPNRSCCAPSANNCASSASTPQA
ncbi:MAG: hypothetical protein IPN38_11810 [Flavobacteriales bacterium]|nr:hypothetical protein [Flavobacteriales bacterium]